MPKWNFPIRKTITCPKCKKSFHVTITQLRSEHKCPHCGAGATIDLNAIDKALKGALR